MCAPPHGFSQLATAFFASIRQGIHRKPYSRLTILLFALKLSFQHMEFFLRKTPGQNRRFCHPSLVCEPSFTVKNPLNLDSYKFIIIVDLFTIYGPG